MGPQGAIQSPGSMGLTSRPKQRYIDRILMKRRDDETDQAHAEVSKFMPPQGPGGAQVMGAGPGTNLFGGAGAFNRPNSLAMMLGGGGQ